MRRYKRFKKSKVNNFHFTIMRCSIAIILIQIIFEFNILREYFNPILSIGASVLIFMFSHKEDVDDLYSAKVSKRYFYE